MMNARIHHHFRITFLYWSPASVGTLFIGMVMNGLCLNSRDLESLTLPLTAPELQTALQLTGRGGSGSSVQGSSMGTGHHAQSKVQQVLEVLKKRQPTDAGKHLRLLVAVNVLTPLDYLLQNYWPQVFWLPWKTWKYLMTLWQLLK